MDFSMHNLASNDLEVDENEKIKYVNLEYTVYGIRVTYNRHRMPNVHIDELIGNNVVVSSYLCSEIYHV